MHRCFRLICVAILLCLAAVAAEAKRAPGLELRDLQGHTQKLSSLRGQIVVLNFWATWCGPCREELPRLSRLQQDYSAKGVRFLAVSIDDSKDWKKIPPLAHSQFPGMDAWLGGNTDIMQRFGLSDIVPATVVIDEKGEIIGRVIGEAREEDVRSRVDWLLHGREGAAPEPLVKRLQ